MYNDEELRFVSDSIDRFLCRAGRNWRHKFLSEHNSVALRIDGDFRDRIKDSFLGGKIVAREGILSCEKFSVKFALQPHVLNRFLLHLDIKSYYESLKFESVERVLRKIFNDSEMDFIKNFYFDSGVGLRRGLCASPFIAEILLTKIDNIVRRVLHEEYDDVVYTRFYDDMLFSCDSKIILQKLENRVSDELFKLGFLANKRKTRIVLTNTSKILGLRIHQSRITVPKCMKNKARLRMHYVSMLYDHCVTNWQSFDFERVEAALGTAIGTFYFILNNSEVLNPKWEKQLKQCVAMLARIQIMKEALQIDQSPFILDDDMKRRIDDVVAEIRKLQ